MKFQFPPLRFLSILPVALSALSFSGCSGIVPNPAEVVNGSWEAPTILHDAKSLSISGKWHLYWKELCTGADCRGVPLEARVPNGWNGTPSPEGPLPAQGYGTYRVRIHLPPELRGLVFGVQLREVGTAYRFFADGREILASGSPGPSPAEHRPFVSSKIGLFSGRAEWVDLAIQVSNFDHRKGGLRHAPVFALGTSLATKRDLALLLDMFAIGAINIMGLYHLILFLTRPSDKRSLLFGVFCLLIVARISTQSECVFQLVFPQASYLLQLRLEYISATIAGPVFVAFLTGTFPMRWNRWLNTVLFVPSAAFCVFVLLTPSAVFTEYVNALSVAGGTSAVVSMVFLIVAAFQRAGGVSVALTGAAVFFLTVGSDILHFRGVHPYGPLLQYGLIVFILAQSGMLARLFASAFATVTALSRTLTNTNRAFARFVPAEFLKYLHRDDVTQVQLGDQALLEMTVLFCDIRSFTKLSETMTPEENFNFLNSYLRRMTPIVNRNGGFIDKYIGDAIMALFPDSVDGALRAGLEMFQELEVYNRHRSQQGYEAIEIGMGIHHGRLMLGIVGANDRMEGTVISDTVNLASRIDALNKRLGTRMLITDSALQKLRETSPETRILSGVRVKGKAEPIVVHDVLGAYVPEIAAVKRQTKSEFEGGVRALQSRRFSDARTAFQAVRAQDPDDEAAAYLQREAERALRLATVDAFQARE